LDIGVPEQNSNEHRVDEPNQHATNEVPEQRVEEPIQQHPEQRVHEPIQPTTNEVPLRLPELSSSINGFPSASTPDSEHSRTPSNSETISNGSEQVSFITNSH
jgi:hypothetical protein